MKNAAICGNRLACTYWFKTDVSNAHCAYSSGWLSLFARLEVVLSTWENMTCSWILDMYTLAINDCLHRIECVRLIKRLFHTLVVCMFHCSSNYYSVNVVDSYCTKPEDFALPDKCQKTLKSARHLMLVHTGLWLSHLWHERFTCPFTGNGVGPVPFYFSLIPSSCRNSGDLYEMKCGGMLTSIASIAHFSMSRCELSSRAFLALRVALREYTYLCRSKRNLYYEVVWFPLLWLKHNSLGQVVWFPH